MKCGWFSQISDNEVTGPCGKNAEYLYNGRCYCREHYVNIVREITHARKLSFTENKHTEVKNSDA
jgi:hypothetical protein